FVAMRGKVLAELVDTLTVGAAANADVEGTADAEYVAAIEGGGGGEKAQGAVGTQRLGDGRDLGLAAGGAGAGDDGDLVHHDGRVLDEDGVGQIGLGRQRENVEAKLAQAGDIGGVLAERKVHVNRLAREVGELAAGEGGSWWANEGGEHL